MKRISLIRSQLVNSKLSTKDANSITITDNRTGKTYNFILKDGVFKASDLETIKDVNGKPLRSYDPAFMNTISCVI
jgi:citrate synthase